MSLINKMLQDLDARAGQPGAAPLPDDVRPVSRGDARAPWRRVAVIGGAVVAVAAAGAVGWRLLDKAAPPVVAPAPLIEPVAIPVAMPVADMPASAPVQVADVAPPTAPVVAAAPEPVPERVAQPAPPAQPAQPAQPAPVPAAPASPAPVKTVKPVPASVPTASGRIEPAAQGAESSYRRALLVLEDGRVTEAIATLQAGLRIDPRHEPSRQTLVGLLIEAKRPDDAMRQLQAALALDPRQPSMAMLLARLQVERGEGAVETLTRTLPYAQGNGDYHAFLAGVLVREGRQREAGEHYQAALRTAPDNGVWWMGLGMALQAEKRDAEAGAAFEQARASGSLSGELQAFVERRLRQLGR